MIKVLIFDTSILCVWLGVPGKVTCGSKENYWDKAKVDFNVLEVSDQFFTNGTTYDPKSVMHYAVHAWQTLDGKSVERSSEISEGDKKIMGALYPKGQKVSNLAVPKIQITNFSKLEVKTDSVRKLSKKSCERKFKIADNNIICRNLFEFYNTITLPTIEEIEEEARRLIKEGYQNKKGKRLIFRNKKGNDYFPDISNLSFVEDALKIFNYLTKNGLMIPRPGNEKSGGRIVDSFTLMPSWIRKLVKVKGVPMAESDYSCLHPNVAMSLYGGNIEYLKHEDLALELGIEPEIVKIEHCFFDMDNPV